MSTIDKENVSSAHNQNTQQAYSGKQTFHHEHHPVSKPVVRHWKGVHQDWVFVEQKGLLTTKWKRVWCAIGRTGQFYIFKRPDAPKPIQTVNLTAACVKDTSVGYTSTYQFELTAQGKCLMKVRAPSNDQKATWINALRETMSKHRGEWASSVANAR